MQSNAEIRSVATNKSLSPRSKISRTFPLLIFLIPVRFNSSTVWSRVLIAIPVIWSWTSQLQARTEHSAGGGTVRRSLVPPGYQLRKQKNDFLPHLVASI